MSIPQDQYFDPTAVGSNLLARGYGNLAGNDVFFYISTTNELRVKQANSSVTQGLSTIQILAIGIRWLCVIQQPPQGIVHLYFSHLDGTMYYAPYTAANFTSPISPTPLPFSSNFTFSATLAPNSSPVAYVIVIDDGVRHTLYTSTSPKFAPLLGTQQIFNNSVDQTHYVNNPTVAMHPLDTNSVTVICERTPLPSGSPEVGFYAVKLPGVG